MRVARPTRKLGALATAAALAAAVALPAAAEAATLSGPTTATVGGHVSIRASKLTPGRYQLFLAYSKTVNGSNVNCTAAISGAKSVGSSATFSGSIPTKLTCRTTSGRTTGTEVVAAGRYDVAVYSPVGANQYNGRLSFVQRSITLT
jgi:hypothetical protein